MTLPIILKASWQYQQACVNITQETKETLYCVSPSFTEFKYRLLRIRFQGPEPVGPLDESEVQTLPVLSVGDQRLLAEMVSRWSGSITYHFLNICKACHCGMKYSDDCTKDTRSHMLSPVHISFDLFCLGC